MRARFKGLNKTLKRFRVAVAAKALGVAGIVMQQSMWSGGAQTLNRHLEQRASGAHWGCRYFRRNGLGTVL